jgi:hypothetical protein
VTSDDQQDGDGRALARDRDNRDFSAVLLKTIESLKNDPAQFRNLIYEMARVQLQKEAWHSNPPMNILELRRMMLALETAVERVETISAQHDAMPALGLAAPAAIPALHAMTGPAHEEIVLVDQAPAVPAAAAFARGPLTGRDPLPLKAILRFGVVAALTVAAVIVLERNFRLPAPAAPTEVERAAAPTQMPTITQAVAAPTPQPAVQPLYAPEPLPSVSGVYAVSAGKLYELEPLAGRVPDQRVFVSTTIKTPSHTVLPDGHVTFIVYGRDAASRAPERAAVRSIARIAPDPSFDEAGRATTTSVSDTWAIRNASLYYRVAPSTDSPGTILISPEADDSVLPAGRYGLFIKGEAYDFTIDGPVVQTTQ